MLGHLVRMKGLHSSIRVIHLALLLILFPAHNKHYYMQVFQLLAHLIYKKFYTVIVNFSKLPICVAASVKPFVLYVVTGQNKALNSADEGNRGFKLNYRQLPCRN